MATGTDWRLGSWVSVALVLVDRQVWRPEPDLIFKRSTVFKWLAPKQARDL